MVLDLEQSVLLLSTGWTGTVMRCDGGNHGNGLTESLVRRVGTGVPGLDHRRYRVRLAQAQASGIPEINSSPSPDGEDQIGQNFRLPVGNRNTSAIKFETSFAVSRVLFILIAE